MQSSLCDHLGQPAGNSALAEIRAVGRRLAESVSTHRPRNKGPRIKPKKGQVERMLARVRSAPENVRSSILENSRLLYTAEKQVLEFAGGLHRFPVATGAFGETPRVCLIAQAYLDSVRDRFDE